MTSKSASVPTWHQIGPEKRAMRKHAQKLSAPDVYAQDSKQEEDVLNPDRLKKGYQYPTTSYEYDSLLFGAKSNRLEKLDEAHQKALSLLASVLYKKGELNFIDKEKKKIRAEQLSQQTPSPTAKDRANWFADLARGKSLVQLGKKVPSFRGNNKSEPYEYLCDYKISPYRALWFLKLYYAFTNTQTPAQKGRRSNADLLNTEPGQILYQTLQNLLTKMWTCEDINNSPHIEKWYYFTTLSKKAFDEGILDKQDFINELTDTFCNYFIKGSSDRPGDENPQLLRLFLTFFIQFMEEINMNIIFARRTAYMAALKIAMLVEEAKLIHIPPQSQTPLGPSTPVNGSDKPREPKENIDLLMDCKLQYPNVMLLAAILRSVVIDTPAALVWNEFKIEESRQDPLVLHHLCGSALDVLPCDIPDLPHPTGKERDHLYQLVEMRVAEIVRRSQAVQDRWLSLSHQTEEYAFGQHFASLTESCLDVIGVLDSANLFQPNIIQKICHRLFNFKSDFWNQEIVIRVKLLLQWAVTKQREGTHRAIIVAKILRQQIMQQQSSIFGTVPIQAIILNYFMTEAPKNLPKDQSNSPTASSSDNFYHEEFGSAVVLFMELVQKGLFDHDTFVKNAIRTGDLDYQHAIIARLEREGKIANINAKMATEQKPPTQVGMLQAKTEINDGTMFDLLPSPQKRKKPNQLITYGEPESDEHILLDEPIDINEKLLIQMPIRQKEQYRAEANQRSLVLYGMTERRDVHKNELKEVAKEICKIWKRKVYVQFNNDDENVWCPRRITSEKLKEALDKFKRQTYYDQVVICGWCAESFSEMIEEFVQGNSLQMPTSEGLDILCQMFEYARYYYGIFELCEAILPLLGPAEKIVRSLAADCIPGSLAGQLGYVFVAYLSKHWHYFLHSDKATPITAQLYELVERLMKAELFPMTSWGRMIGAFVFHARDHLVKSQMIEPPAWSQSADFKKIFFHGAALPTEPRRYNHLFFRDVFQSKVLRFYSYHEYKKRLHSFDVASNRYSFVINAIRAATQAGRDVDNLIELSAFCGHISAQIPSLAEEWITAFKVLCSTTSSHTSGGYNELFTEINLNDCSTHFAIAAFAALLAGKYAFSTPRLVAQLLDSSLAPLMKKDSGRRRSESDNEPGVCICLMILANICCASDEPFILSSHYTGSEPKRKLLNQTADEIALSMIHWCEMGRVLFPMLSYMVIIMDTLRNRHKDLELDLSTVGEGTAYRKEYLINLVRAAQHIICEQPWVTETMYRIVTTNRMEAFNQERLKIGSIGQQLLRMGIRRRSERHLVQELYVSNGGSKKALVDKLLSALNIWNFRATLFDLSLMIKEISPEGAQKHAQQGAMVADALMNEMGKCVRDMFTNAHKELRQLPEGRSLTEFRFADICRFWLIAPLVRLCPQPANVPQQFHSTSLAISGKFLKEAASMLDITTEGGKERIHQSTWLLSQQPFINLILTCLKCEDEQQNKDTLVSSLYKQLQELVGKAKDNPAPMFDKSNAAEREGLLLRLSLVGSIFTELYRLSTTENWCLLFFQIMFYGIIHPERERLLYDSCYDMLSTLMLWTLTDADAIQPVAGSDKYRWPNYSSIIKKLKKEIGDQRIPAELRGLLHFLPIPRCSMDVIATEPYGTISSALVKQRYPRSEPPPLGLRRARWSLQPADRIRLMPFDCVPGFVADNSTNKTIAVKWGWFQGTRLDQYPVPPQRVLIKLIKHEHVAKNEFPRTSLAIMDSPSNDQYLSAPQVEADPRQQPMSMSSAMRVQQQQQHVQMSSSSQMMQHHQHGQGGNNIKTEHSTAAAMRVEGMSSAATVREYATSIHKSEVLSQQLRRDAPSVMSSAPDHSMHLEQKPNVALLKQAMPTATPPAIVSQSSSVHHASAHSQHAQGVQIGQAQMQTVHQQDMSMHYDTHDNKGAMLQQSMVGVGGPEPLTKTRGTRKRNSGNSTRGGGVRQRRTNSKAQEKETPLQGQAAGAMGPGPQGYHPQQPQQMHNWQNAPASGYQQGGMYQGAQPSGGPSQMSAASMQQQGSHTVGYGPLPTGHQTHQGHQQPSQATQQTQQAHQGHLQQSLQAQQAQQIGGQITTQGQGEHMQAHTTTHHTSHAQHSSQPTAGSGSGAGHTINPEARNKLAKLATDRMQRKEERSSFSGPSGAEAQHAAQSSQASTQPAPNPIHLRVKQEIVDRQANTPNTSQQQQIYSGQNVPQHGQGGQQQYAGRGQESYQQQQQQPHFNIKQEYGTANMGQPMPQSSTGGFVQQQTQRGSSGNLQQMHQQQQHYQPQQQTSQAQNVVPVSHSSSGAGMSQAGPQPRNQQGQFVSRSDIDNSNYGGHMQSSQASQMQQQQPAGHQTQASQPRGTIAAAGAGGRQMTASQQQQLAMQQQVQVFRSQNVSQQNYAQPHYDMQQQQQSMGMPEQMPHVQQGHGQGQSGNMQQMGYSQQQYANQQMHHQMQGQQHAQQPQQYYQQQMIGGYQGDSHQAQAQQRGQMGGGAPQQQQQQPPPQQFRQQRGYQQGIMQGQPGPGYQQNPNQQYQR